MAEQTPVPAEALEAAAKVALRRYESEHYVSPDVTWQSFVAEIHEFVEAAAPALLAAGRTAAAAAGAKYAISFDGDTHWLECAWCESPVKSVTAGDTLEEIVIRAQNHERACGAARVAENGADR